ncbi:hypothetical protein ACFPYN_13575 [Paenisporosarcina macmurdoensis]|uniref:Uncharacterized protein n=1 Tax=Paenisporosarcina macmurdoensis TaxID=212659 RepID=A0ABW1LB51_9BACL
MTQLQDELAILYFQAKNEFLIRDKFAYYLFKTFMDHGLIPIREWTWQGSQAIDLAIFRELEMKESLIATWNNDELIVFKRILVEEGIIDDFEDITSIEEANNIQLEKIFNCLDTKSQNLILDTIKEQNLNNFVPVALFEFKCEYTYHDFYWIEVEGLMIKKDLNRMKVIRDLYNKDLNYYGIILGVHFENNLSFNSKYWELNSHFEKIYKTNTSPSAIKNKIKFEFEPDYKVTEQIINVGKIFEEEVSIYAWIISEKQPSGAFLID